MNFPLITIPDPAAVGAWLDEQVPQAYEWKHHIVFSRGRLSTMHWTSASTYVDADGKTFDELLANLRHAIESAAPLAKLRKDAESHGFALMKLPTD